MSVSAVAIPGGFLPTRLWLRRGAWLALAIAGLALLGFALPQQKLHHLANLKTSLTDQKEILIQWGKHSIPLGLRGTSLPAIVFALLLLPWLSLFVDKDHNLAIPQSALRSLLLVFVLFFLSMTVTAESWPGVLYLCLCTVGAWALVVGAANLFRAEDFFFPASRQYLGKVSHTLRYCFFAVPPSLFLAAGMALHLGVTLLLSNVFFGRTPQDPESTIALMRAIDLLHGKNAFALSAWESWVPRGYVYLLTVGAWLGSSWLLNPLFGALTLPMIYLAAREIYGDPTARLAATFYLLSPLAYLMSSQFTNHVPVMFLFCAMIYLFARAVKTSGILSAMGVIACFGAIILIRPLTALGLSIPFTLVALIRTATLPRHPHRTLTVSLVAMSILLVYLGLTTQRQYGSPFLFADDLPVLKTLQSGVKIKESITSARDYEKEKALSHLSAMNLFLFQWPLPSLLFVWLLFLLGAAKQFDYLLGASFMTLSLAAAFHPLPRLAFGPYLVYESLGVLVILTARGVLAVQAKLSYRLKKRTGVSTARSILPLAILALLGLSLVFTYPPLVNYFHDAAFGFKSRALF